MTVFMFPGQGSQHPNMARDFHDNFKTAKLIFEEIEDFTSINLRKIIFSDNDELLNQTDITQLSIFASSAAIFYTLIDENKIIFDENSVMLGHSLGEYTALTCSKKLSLKDASILLKKRGSLMHNALEKKTYGMAALIGSPISEIYEIIKENNLNLDIANDNSPIQVVISGKIKDLNKSEEIFKKHSTKKFIKLNVSSSFHSKYMIEAQNDLNYFIQKVNFQENKIKIISNYSANYSDNNLEIIEALKKQMANTVNWTKSIKNLESVNEKNIIEIGPGKVLSGLVKRISNYFNIQSINNIDDLKGFINAK